MKVLIVTGANEKPSTYLVGALVKAGKDFECISKEQLKENLKQGSNVGKIF